MTILVDQVIVD